MAKGLRRRYELASTARWVMYALGLALHLHELDYYKRAPRI